jgi:thioredoxin reductase
MKLVLDTAILGAGPYGLSIAAHLHAGKRPFQLIGTPMESWRAFMPEGMVLKSEPFASNLWDPQRRYTLKCYFKEKGLSYQAVGKPLSLALFLEYAEWFRKQATPDSHDARVVRVQRAAAGFSLILSDGTRLTARRVVLATGHMAFRVLPPELEHLAEPLVLHSSRIGDVRAYAGRDVVVIGAGQSALESAALLHEAGARVRVLVRQNRVWWNPPSRPRSLPERLWEPDAGVASGWRSVAISELPRVFRWYFPAQKRHWFVARAFGPSGAWWLRSRVDDRVALDLGCRIQEARSEKGKVRLRVAGPSGIEEFDTDHVVAATGFKVDIDRLDYLEPSLRDSIEREAAGIPALDSRFETSVPGLFIVGVASSPVFGPIMRFMYGAKHVAPVLARRLKSAA